jgi:hypothetical protein
MGLIIVSKNYYTDFLGLTLFGHMCANFINRFLRLLSEYDWTFSALVVDINNDLGPNDEKEISVSSAAE